MVNILEIISMLKNITMDGKKLIRSFHFTFHYIDDVLSLNISKTGDFIDHIYPTEPKAANKEDTGQRIPSG